MSAPLAGLRRRVHAGAAALARSALPWLGPRHWTSENLRRLAAGVQGHPRRSLLLLLAGVLLIGAILLPPRRDGANTVAVREGPFRVSIVEPGTLQALRSVSYASRIQSNQAKIVALVPEGKLVEKGDLLILFDVAPFEDEIRRSQAQLAQAQAEMLKAREDLKLQGLKNREDLLAARLRVERSELELKDVEQGQGQVAQEEAAQAVANAERDLVKARSQLEDRKALLAEGFVTRLELEQSEQQLARAQEDLDLARRRRAALEAFGRPLALSQARSEARTSRETLRQLETASPSRSSQKRAEVAAAQSRVLEASAKLELARQQLARCEVRAKGAGIVVYRDVFFGSERRKPQVGDQVWANQPLLILPDISRMVVETTVRETDLHKLAREQKVAIRVEAYPELRLTGKVSQIGTLAQEQPDRHGTKFFSVTVPVDQSDPRLRPGMTARVEIEVERRKDALHLPLDAVFEREGRTLVFLPGRHPRPHEVVLGPSNADFVVIEGGLVRGERVLLRDPEIAPPEGSGAGP